MTLETKQKHHKTTHKRRLITGMTCKYVCGNNKTYRCRCCQLGAEWIVVHEIQRPASAQVDMLQPVAVGDRGLPGRISCPQLDRGLGAAGPCVLAGSCSRSHPTGKLSAPLPYLLQNVTMANDTSKAQLSQETERCRN